MKKFTFIDLFAGIGGFRIACEELNGECLFSSEINKDSCKTYKENFGEDSYNDITKQSEKKIPNFDLLCGGFPCQSFSMAGKRLGFEDTRGTLIYDIIRILKYKTPKAFILENVAGLLSHENGRTFGIIRKLLGKTYNSRREVFNNPDALSYNLFYKVLNSANFGLAQNRNRIFIIGFRDDIKSKSFKFPIGNNNKVIINDILEKNINKKYYLTKDEIEKLLKKENRSNLVNRLENIDKPAKTIIASYGQIGPFGSSYINTNEKSGAVLPEFAGKIKKTYGILSHHIIERKIPKRISFKRKNGKWQKSIKLHRDNEQPRTITSSYGSGGTGEENYLVDNNTIRIFTPRECARLQGFPESFKIHKKDGKAYKQFGNAVSPPVIKAIVKNILKIIKE